MTRLTAVCQTAVGGGSLSAGISPAELSSCHSATTATGLISRYQPRCRRGRAAAAGFGPVYGPSIATLVSPAASSRPSWSVARPASAASGMREPRKEHENLRSSELDEGRRAQNPRFQRSTVSSPKG